MNEIQKKTYSSIVAMVVYLWILLFVPAWSLNFWQAWVFLIVFVCPIFVTSVYFLQKSPMFMKTRLRVGPWAEKETSQKIIQTFSAIFFFSLLVVSGLDHRFYWSSVPPLLTVFGDIIILIGFWIVFLTFQTNSFASAIIERQQTQQVVATGIYSKIRHPMYLGASCIVGAMPCALGSWWAGIGVFGMGIFLVLRVLQEEAYLSQNLPGYRMYCKKVQYRLIPYVW